MNTTINTVMSEGLPHLIIWTLASGALMLGARRIKHLLRLFMLQSLALIGILLALGQGHEAGHTVWLMALTAFGIKCVAIPIGFSRVFKSLEIRDELYTYVQPPTLMLLGGLALLLAQWLTQRIALTGLALPLNVLGCGLTLVMFGFLIMITRRKALTQILGLYVLDNGIFALAIATVFEMPMMVEIGIFLELLLGALILGLMIFRIQQSFDSLDVTHMRQLKG